MFLFTMSRIRQVYETRFAFVHSPSIASALSKVYHLKADENLFRSDDRTLFEGCCEQFIDRCYPTEDLQALLFSTEIFHTLIFVIFPIK
jgi:hypothetical protein